MIKNRETAETVLRMAMGINSALNDSLYGVRDAEAEEDYKQYRLAVGHVIAEVFEQIIEPVVK